MPHTIELKKLDLVQFNQADYIAAERVILENLKASLSAIKDELPSKKLSEKATLDAALEILEEAMKEDCLNPNPAKPTTPFYQNTRLWQNTSRMAPRIKVKKCEGNAISAFDFIDAEFEKPAFRRRYFLFNASLRKAWSEIKLAKQHRDEIRKKAKRQFLYAAKNDTAKMLLEKLEQADMLSQNFEKEIKAIQDLKTWDETNEPRKENDTPLIETSSDCLKANLKIHNLSQELQNTVQSTLKNEIFVERNKMDEINDLCIQLELISKRWLDPHFKNPTKLTSLDKFRFGMKIFIGIISALAAIAAFAMLFTPLAPLAPFVAMIAMVGMAPIVDTMISTIYCGIRYKRSPQKIQIAELISLPIIATISFGLSQLSNLSHIVKIIWDGFNKYGSQILGTIINPIYTVAIALGLKKATDTRILAKQDLKKHSSVPAEAACEILQKNALVKNGSPLTAKASSLPALKTIKRVGSHSRYSLFFINPEKGHIESKESTHKDLKTWALATEKDPSPAFAAIQKEVCDYLELDSGSCIEKRQNCIGGLLDKIGLYQNDNQNEKLKLEKLKPLVEQEKSMLEEIQEKAQNEKEEGHIILGH